MSENAMGPSSPSWKKRALSAVFNRQNAGRALSLSLLVDTFGYAGEYGTKLLNSNSYTAPAAIYYNGFGKLMNFSWTEGKKLALEIHGIVTRDYTP